MKTHSLDEYVPSYTAISYSWLTEHGWTRISCDSQDLVVQRTLEQLLRRLRARFGSAVLWIDSLCISDEHRFECGTEGQAAQLKARNKPRTRRERESQVERMDQIYRSAAQVLVWLGEEDEETIKVDDFFHTIEQRGQNGQALPWQLDPKWDLIAGFLNRQWFTRTWVLQELVLARECVVCCGGHLWSWERLGGIFQVLLGLQMPDTSGIARRLRQNVFGVSQSLKEEVGRQQSSDTLLDLLASARGLDASRKLDKVFALLPICQDRFGIQVNYDQSAQELYVAVATTLLRGGQLRILRHAGESVWNEVPGLPSWVPDWSCSDRPADLPIPKSEQIANPDETTWPVLRGRKLIVEVIFLDTVQRTGVPWVGNRRQQIGIKSENAWAWDIASRAYVRFRHWHSMLWPRKVYQPTGESIDAAFVRTIVADSVDLPHKHSTWETVQKSYKSHLWERLSRGVGGYHSARSHGVDDLKDLNEAVRSLCYKRTFFLSQKRFTGLGPFFTLPGDRIAEIPGADSLFILRRSVRGGYKLVGQCYVHGGELMKEVRPGPYRKRIVIE